MISPCTAWATSADLPESCSDAAVRPTTLASALTFASTVLFNLTKKRWKGTCTDTYRPFDTGRCWNPSCVTHGGTVDWQYKVGSVSYQYDHNAIRLPVSHVRSITSITINGTAIDLGTVEVRDQRMLYRKLTRTDGAGPASWPCWQDMHRWDGEKDSFVIMYSYGVDPPPEMVTACALLAWEFAIAWTPECTRECRLPRNITSLSRGGVSVTFPDPAMLFKDGLTRVPEIDMLIQSVMFGEARSQPLVAIPGKPALGSRSTWHT